MDEQMIAVQLQSQTTCNKSHSSYQVKLQKEVKSTRKQPNCKKRCSPCKKGQHEKSFEIKSGGPGVAVMVG